MWSYERAQQIDSRLYPTSTGESFFFSSTMYVAPRDTMTSRNIDLRELVFFKHHVCKSEKHDGMNQEPSKKFDCIT